MGEKRCARCRIYRALDEFYANPVSRDGLQSWCKQCTKQAVRDRRERGRANV